MKKCEYCGHINEDIFKVCARCGRGLQSKPNMTENEYQQQKKESVTKSEIETLSNEELKKAIESKIFSEKEAEFAKDILIKREAFAKFPDSELKKCITMDMYDSVDKNAMKAVMQEREASTSNDERLQSIERILARQTKDIHLITNCIVFLTVVVALELIASLIFGINLASAFSGLLS